MEGTAPRSPLPNLRQPDPPRPYAHPQRQELRHTLGGRDSFDPLVPPPLGRELRQPLHVCLRGLERARVDPELEPRAEAQRPQDPQVVLLKPPVGVPHRANQLVLEVLGAVERIAPLVPDRMVRSEEHTSELQSLAYLVCRLLLEKKKKKLSNSTTVAE